MPSRDLDPLRLSVDAWGGCRAFLGDVNRAVKFLRLTWGVSGRSIWQLDFGVLCCSVGASGVRTSGCSEAFRARSSALCWLPARLTCLAPHASLSTPTSCRVFAGQHIDPAGRAE